MVPHRTVLLHDNARVMISMNRQGVLRIHRGYAWAPDPVLEAIVVWANPRLSREGRRRATRTVLAFPAGLHAPSRPRRSRRREAPEPGDEARILRLRALHAELNRRHFGGALAPITIHFSGRMRRKLGHYEPATGGHDPAIVLSRRHLRRHGWPAVEETLLHEMVHQWQEATGRPLDHGRDFKRKAREVGIDPAAVVRIS
jgi:hypothetical protein